MMESLFFDILQQYLMPFEDVSIFPWGLFTRGAQTFHSHGRPELFKYTSFCFDPTAEMTMNER